MDKLTVADFIAATLEQEGVRVVFGLPGGPIMPLWRAFHDCAGLTVILAKHEQGAVFMADGYARVSGGLGVVCTTTGPGTTNAVTGIAGAYQDSIPLLLLTGQVATTVYGRSAAQESSPFGIDVVAMLKATTKLSVQLPSGERAPDVVRGVIRYALTGRRGPVHLSLPANMLRCQLSDPLWKPEQSRAMLAATAPREAIREATALLLNARRPAIVAGAGVPAARAWDELRHVAELLGTPVATTPRGKGAFVEEHPLAVRVLGFGGSRWADAAVLEQADVVFVVASSLGEAATSAWDPRWGGKQLIQLDLDPSAIGKNYPVALALEGDARAILRDLADEITAQATPNVLTALQTERREALVALKREHAPWRDAESASPRSWPLDLHDVMTDLGRALPRDALVFVDIGHVMAGALHWFTVREAGTFVLSVNWGAMGHSVAAAIGGKLAQPDRTVVAIVGDAAFAMLATEIHTAVEYRLNVVWIVVNNAGHGMVSAGERVHSPGKAFTALFRQPLDVVGMATAMGALGLYAPGPGDVALAVRRGLAAQRPTVIEVPMDHGIEAPGIASRLKTLDGFFEEPTP